MIKFIIKAVVILAIIATVLIIANWNTIQRLKRVNSLFDADKIVHNFSNMDDLVFSHDLPATAPTFQWGSAPTPLPETVMIGGTERDLEDWLTESSTTSLLVIKGDDILFEQYYLDTKPEDRRISWSVAKSYMSALIGTALERGEIKSLDDKVTDYAPILADSAYRDATLRNVLHMSSGVNFNEDYLDHNSDINRMGRALAFGTSMDEFAASLKISDRAPGTGRLYVSVDTHVLGMVMRGATERSIHDLFLERIWSKIGPSNDAYYLTDKGDRAFVLGGLNITTRDYALFGKLYRDGGKFNDQQVIPEHWVTESTQNSAPADVGGGQFGYGYQWWLPAQRQGGDFYANGIYGQVIYVNPEADIVIVKTSAHREFQEPGQSGKGYKAEFNDVCQSLSRYFLPRIQKASTDHNTTLHAQGDYGLVFGLAPTGTEALDITEPQSDQEWAKLVEQVYTGDIDTATLITLTKFKVPESYNSAEFREALMVAVQKYSDQLMKDSKFNSQESSPLNSEELNEFWQRLLEEENKK